jgi:hypothetical protein
MMRFFMTTGLFITGDRLILLRYTITNRILIEKPENSTKYPKNEDNSGNIHTYEITRN